MKKLYIFVYIFIYLFMLCYFKSKSNFTTENIAKIITLLKIQSSEGQVIIWMSEVFVQWPQIADGRKGMGLRLLCVLAFRPVAACPLQAHTGNLPNQFMFIQEQDINSGQLERVQGLWVQKNPSLSDSLLCHALIQTLTFCYPIFKNKKDTFYHNH